MDFKTHSRKVINIEDNLIERGHYDMCTFYLDNLSTKRIFFRFGSIFTNCSFRYDGILFMDDDISNDEPIKFENCNFSSGLCLLIKTKTRYISRIQLKGLEKDTIRLDLSSVSIKNMRGISAYENLEVLDISGSDIERIDKELFQLKKLRSIQIFDTDILDIPSYEVEFSNKNLVVESKFNQIKEYDPFLWRKETDGYFTNFYPNI